MLSCLYGKASDRQLRLFVTSYCRRNWHLIQDQGCRKAIEVAELAADGQVGESELRQVYIETSQIWSQLLRTGPADTLAALVADSCRRAVRPSERLTPTIIGIAAGNLARGVAGGADGESERGAWNEVKEAAWEAERWVQVDLLRDIFGNPFRPITLNPAWRTPTVISLGETIYSEEAFDLLPILGDALEDDGCNSQEILDHCRSGGEHVRGCWAVDLVLGKE